MTERLVDPSVVTLLGFGEAGGTIARGLADTWRGAGGDARQVLAVDIALGDGPRGAAMAALARELDVDIGRDYTAALGDTGLVISVVTCEDAVDAARAAKPWLAPGTFYLDFNSITGLQTRDVAAVFEDTGVGFIDVAVMGTFDALGMRAPMLLAGPDADTMAEWMNRSGFAARVLASRVGDASAVKILRTVVTKGIEALAVECLVAAHRQGLVAEVLDNFSDIDAQGFAGFLETLTVTHLVHAKRRLEEIERAALNLRETEIEPLMTEATHRSHERTCDAGVSPADGAKPSLEEALKILSERVVGYRSCR